MPSLPTMAKGEPLNCSSFHRTCIGIEAQNRKIPEKRISSIESANDFSPIVDTMAKNAIRAISQSDITNGDIIIRGIADFQGREKT
jgi:hypothetical protein